MAKADKITDKIPDKITEKMRQALTRRAVSGDPQAQFELACAYSNMDGKGDKGKFFHWLTMAAESDHAEAQCSLGNLYRTGEGIGMDLEKAVYWLDRAVKNGDFIAAHNLGLLVLQGLSTYENESFVAMVKNSDTQLIDYIDKLDEVISKVSVENISMAIKLLTLAANDEDDTAQSTLALIHYCHESVKDDAKFFYWLKKAANTGNLIAQTNLGMAYARGLGTDKNYKKSLYWLTKAAENGYLPAQNAIPEIRRLREMENQKPDK
jgi:TPR repeat protein